jgi:hypothetical protein
MEWNCSSVQLLSFINFHCNGSAYSRVYREDRMSCSIGWPCCSIVITCENGVWLSTAALCSGVRSTRKSLKAEGIELKDSDGDSFTWFSPSNGFTCVQMRFCKNLISIIRSWLRWFAVVTPSGESWKASFKAVRLLHCRITEEGLAEGCSCSVLYLIYRMVRMLVSSALYLVVLDVGWVTPDKDSRGDFMDQ